MNGSPSCGELLYVLFEVTKCGEILVPFPLHFGVPGDVVDKLGMIVLTLGDIEEQRSIAKDDGIASFQPRLDFQGIPGGQWGIHVSKQDDLDILPFLEGLEAVPRAHVGGEVHKMGGQVDTFEFRGVGEGVGEGVVVQLEDGFVKVDVDPPVGEVLVTGLEGLEKSNGVTAGESEGSMGGRTGGKEGVGEDSVGGGSRHLPKKTPFKPYCLSPCSPRTPACPGISNPPSCNSWASATPSAFSPPNAIRRLHGGPRTTCFTSRRSSRRGRGGSCFPPMVPR